MKAHIPILIAGIILLGSCEKLKTATTDFPTSITLQGINISGAEGLAIMNVPKESAQTKASTKADEDMPSRLCIVSKDGTKIAEFNMKIEGSTNNPVWERIYPTLTYVPQKIIDISSNFILLANVGAYYDQDLLTDEEKFKGDVRQRLEEPLSAAEGCYLLRKSSGTLYRCPFYRFPDIYSEKQYWKENCDFNETSDKKTITYGGMICFENNSYDGLMLIKDAGSKLESLHTNEQMLGGNYSYLFSYLPDDDHCIVFSRNYSNGAWSFDMNLSPTFVDYSTNLKSFPPQIFVPNGNAPYIIGSDNSGLFLGKITLNGSVLDYVKISQLGELFGFPEHSRSWNGNKLTLSFTGTTININTDTDVVTIIQYPDDFPKDRRLYTDGVYYQLSSDFKTITRYDLNTMKKTTVNVNWAGYDELVSGTNYGGVGFFTVTGLSRTAATLSYLINQDTGEVTLLESQTYTAPAVTSYLPLN